MTTTMMMDRAAMTGTMPMGAGVPTAAPNMVMVPRGTMTFEKCAGGTKITCVCDDATACVMMQNLCTMLAGGLCSVSCMMNGMTVCCCNLTIAACKVEMTKDGCCVTCTSGDQACCDMIQGFSDCLTACIKGGCTCCLSIAGTPVCCCIC